MKTPELPTDELFQVERRIARRADELDRQFGRDPLAALEHWRQAEREVWREQTTTADETRAACHSEA